MWRPRAQVTTTTTTVTFDENLRSAQQGCVPKFGIHFGNPTVCGGLPGITFNNITTVPSGFIGTEQWVQVITSFAIRYQTNNASGAWLVLRGANLLDGPYPYSTDPNSTQDSPGANIDEPPCQSKALSISCHFEMFLEFKPSSPTGAQWVPLSKVVWGYGGQASLTGPNCTPDDWTPSGLTHSQAPPGSKTEQYPWWTNEVRALHYEWE
jgi:hypothetical protein